MRHVTCVVASVVILCTVGVGGQVPSARKTPERGLLTWRAEPPPPSFDALWASSPVIIRAEITHSKVRQEHDRATGAPPAVLTEHTVRILEVLKDDGSIGTRKQTSFAQHGGTLEIRGMLLTANPSPLPLFGPGNELLLFLTLWKSANSFAINYATAGVYVLDEEKVEIHPTAKHFAASFGGRREVPKAEFLSIVRSKKK